MSEDRPNILYVQTSGTESPERLYAPFILGSTAAAMNIDVTIYFLIKGVTVLKKGEAEEIRLGTFPSLDEVIEQALEAGVKLMVCEQSCMLLGIERGDFIPAANIVGAATLNDLLLKADATLSF